MNDHIVTGTNSTSALARRDWLKAASWAAAGTAGGLAGGTFGDVLGDLAGGLTSPMSAWGQDVEIPAPEQITLETKDFVSLRCTYFAGIHGKKTIPIIMVHGFKGRRTEYERLALYLQKTRGHAVITVDLRGHGDSTRVRGRDGDDKKVAAADLRPDHFAQMVTFDLERVKKFIIEKNNEEQLNADQLCVVAAGDMGCVVALNWILSDWSWSASPKQGQDVKGAVLLSPAPIYKSLKTQPAFAHPFVAGKMSTMLIGGKTEAGLKNLYNQFKAKHAPTPTDEEEAAKHQDLFYIPLDTELRGTDLLHPDLMMWDVIRHFLDLRFVNKAENFPWQERKSPISK